MNSEFQSFGLFRQIHMYLWLLGLDLKQMFYIIGSLGFHKTAIIISSKSIKVIEKMKLSKSIKPELRPDDRRHEGSRVGITGPYIHHFDIYSAQGFHLVARIY